MKSIGLVPWLGLSFLLFCFLGRAKADGLICGACNDPKNSIECNDLNEQIMNETVSNKYLTNYCYRCVKGTLGIVADNSIFDFFGCVDKRGIIFGRDGRPLTDLPKIDVQRSDVQIGTVGNNLVILNLCDSDLCNLKKPITVEELEKYLNYTLVGLGAVAVLLLLCCCCACCAKMQRGA